MKRKLTFGFFFAVSAMLLPYPANAQILVIANRSVRSAEISDSDLRDVFTGAVVGLPGGERVMPVLLKDGQAHEEFLTRYFGESDAAFRADWRRLVFSGRSTMPKTVDSEEAMMQYVARTPGAIGYISESASHQDSRQEVKVLVILSHDLRAERADDVVNLVRYVEWPSPGPALVIGFMGDSAGARTLERAAAGVSVNGRPLRVARSGWENLPGSCDALYVSETVSPADVSKALGRIKDRNILTMGESHEFVEQGGILGLVDRNDHIRIEVNPDTAQRAGIKISSHVLTLAIIVQPGGR
jgi:hypothetical protein